MTPSRKLLLGSGTKFVLTGLILFFGIIAGLSQPSQTFTSSGTFNVPAGVTSVTVECWGGGGAGDGFNGGGQASAGGGGGAYSRAILPVVPLSGYTVTVGAGGFGNSGVGTSGGDSWFSSTGTILAKGGSAANGSTPGAGGLASAGVGTFKYDGGAGGNGFNSGSTNSATGGGGGSSAGTSSNGSNGQSALSEGVVGAGGIAPSGGGNGGVGGYNVSLLGIGGAGSAPGGGGGGAGYNNTANGGNGASGKVVVTWDDGTPYLSPNVMTLYSFGAAAEKIVFNVNEQLILVEGASVTGFSVSSGSIGSAIYSGKGTTNTITLTNSGGDGTWTNSTTVSYSGGNVADLTTLGMPPIISHAVVEPVSNAFQQSFTTNGTYTVSAGVTSITVECWGGGGGGALSTSGGGAGGGGGGAYSRSILSVTPLTGYNVTVGSGGAPAASQGSPGSPGGSSSFGAGLVLAMGGNGAFCCTGSGGSGGLSSAGTGTIKFSGGTGGNPSATGGAASGGGGGSSAGIISNGNNGTSGISSSVAGIGGSAPIGGGKGGDGGPNGVNGNGGSSPGGGGGGSGASAATGGIGANGLVTVYYSPTAPFVSPDVMNLYPNGSTTEIIVFSLTEELNLLEGAAVTGFSVSSGSVGSAVYSGKGTTNKITLVNGSADGTWNSTTTVNYYTLFGNVVDLSAEPMGNIVGHSVTELFQQVQSFTSSGTFTVPAGVTSVTVEMWGGGGGGGMGNSLTNAGGGGGGGAYTKSTVSVVPLSGYPVSVGIGGIGSVANCCPGSGGGNSSFGGSLVVAAGGIGGASGSIGTGGPGGNAASGTGTIKFSGGNGGDKDPGGGSVSGGGGGSSAGTGAIGTDGGDGAGANTPGIGGVAPAGGGNGATGGKSNENGNSGSYPGGGGGGSGSNASSGGTGGNGKVVITYSLPGASTQTYSTGGAYTYNVPAGVTSVSIEAWGAGGGGGGSDSGGGGGAAGGGAYSKSTVAVVPLTGYPLTVGYGGPGSSLSSMPGFAGGPSSFNSGALLAMGGSPGQGANSGTGGSGGQALGGVGTIKNDGGNGGSGNNSGGGGGSSAGTLASGSNGSPGGCSSCPAPGGIAPIGGGNGGSGGLSGSNGTDGSSPGGGGGGGGTKSGGPTTGGKGADGQMIISYSQASAALTYNDADGIVKAGQSLIITATFSEAMNDAPITQIVLSGANNLAATNMVKSTPLLYTYTHTVGAGNGIVTPTLATGTNATGNVVFATPSSGMFFIVDNTAPTSTATYTKTPLKNGNAQTITLTFSENLTVIPKITVTGPAGTIVNNLNMTVGANASIWTYNAGTTWTGDGNATVTVGTGTDAAGNIVVATPTNNTFVVDNTAPTSTATYTKAAVKNTDSQTITLTFNENLTVTPKITVTAPAGTVVNNLSMTMGANTTIWTYNAGTTWTGNGAGTVTVSTGTDAAGNIVASTPASNTFIVDNTAPTSTATFTKNPLKNGDAQTVTVTFNENLTVTPRVTVTAPAGTVVNNQLMTMGANSTIWTYNAGTVWTGNGVATVTVGTGTDAAGNLVATTPGTNTFTVDNTASTSTATYTKNFLKNGDAQTVTVTFNENIIVTPNITVTGPAGTIVNNLAMTMGANPTIWTYNAGTTWTGNGTATVTVGTGTDAAGNVVASTPASNTFVVDNTSPTSTATYTKAFVKNGDSQTITVTFNENIIVTPKITVTAPAGTVVNNLNMTMGANPTIWTYAAGTTWTGNGAAAVTVGTGTDAAGNVITATPTSNTFTVDNTAPTSTATYTKSSLKNGDAQTITVTFNENITVTPNITVVGPAGTIVNNLAMTMGANATIWTRIAGTTWTGNGTATVTVSTGTDAAGNVVATTPASNTFTVDNTSPTSTATYTKTPLKNGDSQTITLTFNENLTVVPKLTIVAPGAPLFPSIWGMGDALNGWGPWPGQAVEWTSYSPQKYEAQALLINNNAFRFFAQLDWAPTSYNYPYFTTVDTELTNANDGDFNFRVVAPTGWYRVMVDLAAKTVVVTPTMIMGANPTIWTYNAGTVWTGNGAATVTVGIGTDAAGNVVSTTPSTNTFVVDNTGPTSSASFTQSALKNGTAQSATITFNEALIVTPTITLTGSSSGAIATNQAMSGGPTVWTYSAGTTWTGNQTVTATVAAGTDAAGNVVSASPTTNTFTVDNTPPTVSNITITGGQLNGIGSSNGTSLTSLTYNVTFSESVTGVNATDFALTSLGDVSGGDAFPAVAGTIGTVTGSGSSYAVPVSSVTGTGTLRLDFATNGSVADLVNNANVASFTSGQTYSVVLQEPTNHATGVSALAVGATQAKVSWTNAVGGTLPTHLLILAKQTGVGSYAAVADGTPVAAEEDFSNGNGAALVSLVANPTNYTFSNMTSGVQYDFIIYPLTLSPNNSVDNVNFKTTGNPTVTATLSALTLANLTLGLANSPLNESSTSNAVFGFSMTSNGTQTVSAIAIQASATSVGLLSGFALVRSGDADFSTTGDNVTIGGLTFAPSPTQVLITGLTESISTAKYYFLVANVSAAANGAAAALQFGIIQTNVTVNIGFVTGTATGGSYSFRSSQNSDITFAFGINATFQYIDTQAASGLNQSNAANIGNYTIRDGGGASDTDNQPTVLSSLALDLGSNFADIRTIAIFDNLNALLAEIAVTSRNMSLPGISYSVADGQTKGFSLWVTFKSVVTDKDQIQVVITGATGSNAGSGFTSFGPPNVLTHTLNVTADRFYFPPSNPTTALVSQNFGLTVKAVDANNNTDVDYATGSVALAQTAGSGIFSSGDGLSHGMTAGTAIWSQLQNSVAGQSITIQVTGGLTAASKSITILTPAGAPSQQANTITFSSVSLTTMTVNVAPGNGGYRLIVAKAGSPVDANPVDGITYVPNPAFGNGSQIGNGNYVLAGAAGGVGSTAPYLVTGLTPGTLYFFRAFEFNGSSGTETYMTSTATLNPNSVSTLAIPTITSFNPTGAQVGATVTITGTNFHTIPGDNTVKFNGTTATIVGTPSTTSIVTTVPVGATTGTITVTVTGLTGTSATNFIVFQQPTIANFNPTTGIPGGTVTINGTNFDTTPTNNTVKFNGVDAVVTGTPTPISMTVTVPTGATSGPITVTVNGLTATSVSNFTVIPPPTISNFTASGIYGATVTITGTNFDNTFTSNVVKFNGTTATITAGNSTLLVTTVPTGATTGPITVTVGGQTATSSTNFIVISDVTAPVVVDNTATAINAGSPITITANITDGESAISSATVSYRAITSTATPTSKSLVAVGSVYSVQVLAAEIGELGLEYKITAVSSGGTTTDVSFRAIRINVIGTGQILPYTSHGSDVANYRIVAIPFALGASTVNDVFGDDLGALDKTKWRMYRYDNGATNELSGSSLIEPGKGYWLIVKSAGANINTGAGTTVLTKSDGLFEIDLKADWNQIGNPYNFTINWADVQAANPGLPGLRGYNGDFYDPTKLNAMEGGFVKVNAPQKLKFPVIKGGRIGTTENVANAIDGPNWQVRFDLRQGNLRNLISGLGMNENASEDFDPLDGFNMPAFFDKYLELSHNKRSGKDFYSADIVPSADHHVWEFDVASSSGDSPVAIAWDNSYFGSNDRELYLWDVALQRGINMRKENTYQFLKNASGSFKVIYGSEAFVKEKIAVQNLMVHGLWPNPAADMVTMAFSLPESTAPSSVEFSIIDGTGHTVWSGENVYEGGYHEAIWKRGESVGPGLYLLKIGHGSESQVRRIVLK